MHPEQPSTGLAQQRCQADLAPQGTLCTGLLHRLIQNARPFSFCFLLPRVHAADVAAEQMPSTTSSTSTSPAAPPSSSPSIMPSNMGKPEFPDTGWDRIKDLFDREWVLLFLLYFFFFSFLYKDKNVRFLVENAIIRQELSIVLLKHLFWTEMTKVLMKEK